MKYKIGDYFLYKGGDDVEYILGKITCIKYFKPLKKVLFYYHPYKEISDTKYDKSFTIDSIIYNESEILSKGEFLVEAL